jgi:hypothetical protein
VTTPQQRASDVRALVGAEPALGEPGSVVGWLQQLCAAVVRSLPASGAGVTVMTEAGVGAVVAASDATARSLADLQFMVGEGPSLDAYARRSPVLEPVLDGGVARRWPAYSAAALALGATAVFALPLQVGAARLGVLEVYRVDPGWLTPGSLALALTFAEVALDVLLDGQAQSGQDRPPAGVGLALNPHYVIYQAQGMVTVDLGVSLADAMTRLRAHAYTTDRGLSEVAADVVAGLLRLPSDDR